jgi:hypothetical protein
MIAAIKAATARSPKIHELAISLLCSVGAAARTGAGEEPGADWATTGVAKNETAAALSARRRIIVAVSEWVRV